MTDYGTLPEDLREMLRLDADVGPAKPLSEASQAATVVSLVTLATVAPSSSAPTGWAKHGWSVPLAVVVAVGAAAAWYVGDLGSKRRVNHDVRPEPALPAVEVDRPAPPAELSQPSASPPLTTVKAESKPVVAPTLQAAPAGTDLLEQANRLRGQGRYRAAERTYLRVVHRDSESSAAYVARVAAADLRRERLHDPRGALKLYREALNAPGALSAETLRGIAKAENALGHVAAEREALETLVTAHPHAPTASWAKRRLEEIDGEVH